MGGGAPRRLPCMVSPMIGMIGMMRIKIDAFKRLFVNLAALAGICALAFVMIAVVRAASAWAIARTTVGQLGAAGQPVFQFAKFAEQADLAVVGRALAHDSATHAVFIQTDECESCGSALRRWQSALQTVPDIRWTNIELQGADAGATVRFMLATGIVSTPALVIGSMSTSGGCVIIGDADVPQRCLSTVSRESRETGLVSVFGPEEFVTWPTAPEKR